MRCGFKWRAGPLSHIYTSSILHFSKRMASTSTPSSVNFQFEAAPWLNPFGPTVWHEFSPLALRQGAVNLGQGFPNFEPPEFLLRAAELAQRGQTPGIAVPGPALVNQYARPNGHLRLVKALAKLYAPIIGRDLDPLTQIQITVGASEGLMAAINGVVAPGDEVIVITPFFDIYEGCIARAGGKLVQVPLIMRSSVKHAGEFKLDMDAFKKAMSPKTKAVIINTPHNPTGKVFSREELEEIASVVKMNPKTIVIADEVYEFLVYGDDDGNGGKVKMARMCMVEDMFERTLSISSIAKSMSCTGYKIGWVYGPANLVDAVARTHQFVSYAVVTPLQEAVAVALEEAETNGYWQRLLAEYLARRTELLNTLTSSGFHPITPQGTFFCVCDVSSELRRLPKGWGTRDHETITKQFFDLADWNFCRWLTAEVGVTAIPCSAFYAGPTSARPTNIIRFAFCKKENDLKEAAVRLKKLNDKLPL